MVLFLFTQMEHQFKQKGRLSVSQEKHLFRLTDKYNMDKNDENNDENYII